MKKLKISPKPSSVPQTNYKFIGLSIAITLFLIVLITLGFFLFQTSGQTSKKPASLEKVSIGSSVFIDIANEQGNFKQNGLDVQIVQYDAGPEQVADLLRGNINFAVASDFVGVNSIFTNDNLRIIAQVARRDLFRVIARKDKGIANPVDLKGKNVGVTKKSAGEFYLSRFLVENKVDLTDIHVVNLIPEEMSNKITSGEIDALVTLDPAAYNIQKKLGDNAISWSAQGDEESNGLAYSTDSFIKSHPQTVQRFLDSLVNAEKQVKQNNQQTREFIAQKYNYDNEYLKHYWSTFDFTVSLDQSLMLTLEEQARFLIDSKQTSSTKVPNYLDFIYFDALESIKPEAVTIIH